MGIFDIFKKPLPITDQEIGTLEFDGTFWVTTHLVGGQAIEINIDGKRSEINPFARNYWLNIRDTVENLWKSAIDFTQAELKKQGAPWSPTPTEFKLKNVSVYKERSFDGGHLAFWFEIEPDEEGLYYVSFRYEDPFFLHRDS